MWCGADLSRVDMPRMKLTCPCCERQLEERRDQQWLIHVCPGCDGLWIMPGMLERFEKAFDDAEARLPSVEHTLSDPYTRPSPLQDPAAGREYRRCPQCGERMARRQYQRVSGVLVDECLGHGVWFDAGEFNHVIEFLKAGGLEKSQSAAEQDAEKRRQASRGLAFFMRHGNSGSAAM